MGLDGKLFIREGLTQDSHASHYVLGTVLKDIDGGSEFDQKHGDSVRSAQNPSELISALAEQGYDVMLGYEERNIVGHMAFQEHYEGDEKHWRMFRVFVVPEYRGRGHMIPLSEQLIAKAKTNSVDVLKLGNEKTGHSKMAKLLGILKDKEDELGVRVNPQGHEVNLKP